MEPVSARACSICHKRKIRCDLRPGVESCSNCRVGNLECRSSANPMTRPHQRKRRREETVSGSQALNAERDENGNRTRIWQTPLVQPSPPMAQGSPVQTSRSVKSGPAVSRNDGKVPSPSGSYLGRTEYLGGVVEIDEEDARNYPEAREKEVPDLQIKFLHDLGSFELPARPVRDSLMTNYMERCNPWMPIIEQSDLEASKPSMLLLQSLFVAGSRISTAPLAQTSGQTFYRRAKALYYAGVEKDPLVVLRAICMLQWWNPSGPEHISMDASSFWLHMGVALAHQVGLHREPSPKQADASLRRKLWWTLFTRDCMISVSHGRPRAINMDDCDVRRPTFDDFANPDRDASLFIAYVEICSILADITEASVRGVLGRSRRLSIGTRLYEWISNLPKELHIYNRQTGALASYDFKARQLHVPYFTALSVLYRPPQTGGNPSIAALLASSFVVGIYEDFIARGEVPMLAPVFIFHLMASALAQLPNRRYEALWAKSETEFSIINQALEELSKRFPTGFGAQRVVRQVTKAAKKVRPQDGPPQLGGSAEHLKFFEPFGPELCSKWMFVYGSKNDGENTHSGYKEQSYLPQNSRHGDETEDVLASEATPFESTGPYASGANEAMPPPWSASHELSQMDGAILAIFDSDFQQGSNGLGLDTVGNWMLNDWTFDMNL